MIWAAIKAAFAKVGRYAWIVLAAIAGGFAWLFRRERRARIAAEQRAKVAKEIEAINSDRDAAERTSGASLAEELGVINETGAEVMATETEALDLISHLEGADLAAEWNRRL